MKNLQFENWFKKNKDAFDDKTPPYQVWLNISKQMDWKKKDNQFKISEFMWKAAAIIFFGISCYLYGKSEIHTINMNKNDDFKNIEAYYLNEIENKTQMLIDYNERDLFPNPETEMELQRMDALYQIIKEEYNLNPSQKLKEALMLNLLIRDDILNEEIETFSL